jgi:hypothetical protein
MRRQGRKRSENETTPKPPITARRGGSQEPSVLAGTQKHGTDEPNKPHPKQPQDNLVRVPTIHVPSIRPSPEVGNRKVGEGPEAGVGHRKAGAGARDCARKGGRFALSHPLLVDVPPPSARKA